MRIALLADESWETTPRLVEVFEHCGHVTALNPPTTGLAGFDLAVLRGSYWKTHLQFLVTAAERLHAVDTPFLNGYRELRCADDKVAAGDLFLAAGLRVPRTWTASTGQPFPFAAERLIAKPRWGAQQDGVEVFESAGAAQRHVQQDPGRAHLVQEFVTGRYWRVIATPTTVVRGYDMPMDERGVTNLPSGVARTVVTNLPTEVEHIARTAVGAVGGSLMGIDLIEDHGGRVWVLEANNAFGFNVGDRSVESAFVRAAAADAVRRRPARPVPILGRSGGA